MKKLILLFCFSFFSFFAHASLAPIAPGSVSTATGGSGRGVAEPIDSTLLNPAAVSLLATKFLTSTYSNEQWAVTIEDNGRDALFPAALSYMRQDVDGFRTQRAGVIVGYAFKKMLAIGTNISFMEYDSNAIAGDNKYRQTVGDVGVLLSPGEDYGVGLVAKKVASTNTDLDEALQVQQTVGLGTQYTFQRFARFRFDIESSPKNKTNRLVYMGGIETYLNEWIVFRLGYQNNNVVSKNYQTAGVGFAGPQFTLHYAYISNVADTKELQHSIDLGIPF
jgi:hypothetical protein